MDALDSITTRDADGRRILTGSATLPPMTRPAKQNKPSGDQATATKNKPKQKTAERFAVLNAFVDCSMADLTRSEIAVWLVLYRDVRDGSVRTSQADIARRAGTSVRGVKAAVKKLLALELLTVIYQGGLNRGTTRYRVNPLGKRTS